MYVRLDLPWDLRAVIGAKCSCCTHPYYVVHSTYKQVSKQLGDLRWSKECGEIEMGFGGRL